MSETSHLLSKQNSQQPKQFRGGEKKVMKKSLSLLVAIAMVFSMFATLVSAAEKQTDGEYLSSIGVIKGNASGDLLGEEDWKRQDVAVIISRLLGQEAAAKATAKGHEYTDVRGTFYDGYLTWASEKGLMEGNTNGTFGFDAPITYKEFAAVVLRALGVNTTGENYAKVEELAVESGLLPEGTDFKANAIRDVTYNVIVKALDTKVDGVKLGTKLGLPGYEITELELVKAFAVVKSAAILEFNTDLESLKSEDVTVEDADGNAVLVEKATIDGSKVTVALSDELESGKTYTVNVALATTKEGFVLDGATANFKYSATEPVSIQFAATTIALGSASNTNELKVIVKDADGNDITANYSDDAFDVQTSDSSIIEDFNAKQTGDVIVNVKLEVNDDETIETGNQIITVKNALSASITDVSFVADNTTGNASDNDVKVSAKETGSIVFVAEDQADIKYEYPNSSDFPADTVSFKSLNPARLVVDAVSGDYHALQEGSATVQITADVGGVKVVKSVIVTVQAASSFASISTSESSVKIVEDATIDYLFTVKTLDQFGETIKLSDATIEVKSSKEEVITATVDGDITTGEANVELVGLKNGSSSVKVTVKADGKTYTRTVSVSQVAQNGFGGYVAEINNATIEKSPNAPKADADMKDTATVSVYAKDRNGNKYEVASNAEFKSKDEKIATVGLTTGVVTPVKAGTVTIEVIVDTAVVATVKVTVVDSAPVITKVNQVKSTITVTDNGQNIKGDLFGKNKALAVLDQYGDAIDNATLILDDNYTIATSDSSVINSSGQVTGEGKATITVSINKQFFVINVNVK